MQGLIVSDSSREIDDYFRIPAALLDHPYTFGSGNLTLNPYTFYSLLRVKQDDIE